MAMLFLTFLRINSLPFGESCWDCYYHVKMADSGPAVYAAKSFPATTLSIWSDRFANKEMGFHAVLGAFRVVRGAAGLSDGHWFHFESLAFCGLVMAAFLYALERLGGRGWVWLTVALVAICPLFTVRLIMLRPHVLSIALMLVATAWCLRLDGRRQLWLAWLIGFVFAWSYSNPHFCLLPAAAGSARLLTRRRWGMAAALPVSVMAGLVSGYIIHPQFPNPLLVWKIQCVDVVRQIVGGSLPVTVGQEFAPVRGGLWLTMLGLGCVLVFIPVAAWWSRGSAAARRRMLETALPVFGMAVITWGGLLLSKRSVEYACPMTLLCAGLVWRECRLAIPPPGRRVAAALAITGLAFLAIMSFNSIRASYSPPENQGRPCLDFAAWAEKVDLPANTVVANINWGDFPLLFHAAPRYRYLVGLDPMFAHHRNPEAMELMESVRRRDKAPPPAILGETLGAEFAFVHLREPKVAEFLYGKGYKIVYQGSDGWLFDLRPEAY